MKCPDCNRQIKKKDLKWYAEIDADEGGVYVIYVGRCPYCLAEVKSEYGYKTTSEEPLRHET